MSAQPPPAPPSPTQPHQQRHRIGVDLGGTKIEAVVLEVDPHARARHRARDGSQREEPQPVHMPRELARARIATQRELGYEHVLSETCALVRRVAEQAGVDVTSTASTSIGVGMPGSITMRRSDGARSDVPLVKNSNTTCLNGQPFRTDLAAALGRPVAFANDANCFALAEATWGAARGARVAFGVIMGTGVGGGLVLSCADATHATDDHGGAMRAWDGAQGIAGEWGHIVLDPDRGPACYCGRRGCVETYLSGPAIEKEYLRRSGVERKLAEIATRASATVTVTASASASASTGVSGTSGEDDRIARELIAECIEIFGRALAIVIDVVDPDVIVLGGGVSNLEAFYDRGPRAVARWVFNDDLATKIVKHTLGDSAGVLGAALLS